MAFAAGDLVTLMLPGTGYAPAGIRWTSQFGPLVGIVEANAGTLTVQWENGARVATIATSTLDELLAPVASEVTRIFGRRVRQTPAGSTSSASGDYSGVVVNMYRRDPASAGTPSATLALVKLDNGGFLEILSSELAVVPE